MGTFQTNPHSLQSLLSKCDSGEIQLPDFQRGWVWDIDRIKSLISSIAKGFPVGAIMALETGGHVAFHPRLIEGSVSMGKEPQILLLDGQQRMTSLYQSTSKRKAVDTTTPKGKKITRWLYFDMSKAIDGTLDLEDAVIAVPEDKRITSDFGKTVDLDLSTAAKEYENLYFPLSEVFETTEWLLGFIKYWTDLGKNDEMLQVFMSFKEKVIDSFSAFTIPVITLDKETTKEAVCLVFEKVNTGGKPLDAFELVTAMYAADGYQLRDDWFGKDGKGGHFDILRTWANPPGQKFGVLREVEPTDLLQVISLLHTRDLRNKAASEGKTGKELPSVTAKREALLDVPLSAYKNYVDQAILGFKQAAQFLRSLNIHRVKDLPYQTQVTVLAAILSELKYENISSSGQAKIKRWYWSGVFGELYGSTTDNRIAKDFLEVGPWLAGSEVEPTTVQDCQFRAERLKTMRMRLSAAYKGLNVLLMSKQSRDWLTGKDYAEANFFEEAVDIHHIFPQKWCIDNKINKDVYDSIINKTPLSARTNRIIGGNAPSKYLKSIQVGKGKSETVSKADLRKYVESHFVDYSLLESDDFESFFQERTVSLLSLVSEAVGKPIIQDSNEAELDFETTEVDDES
jgi:hypothetical protein